jgi:hypothetical protein
VLFGSYQKKKKKMQGQFSWRGTYGGDEDNDNVERVMLWNQQVRKERLLNKYKDFVNMAYQLLHCTPKFSKKAESMHLILCRELFGFISFILN